MAQKRNDPDYVALVNARRRDRDAERKAVDAELVERLRANSKRHYQRRRSDPEFWEPRKEYFRLWKEHLRENEEFEAFMARMEEEEATHA